MKKIKRNYSDVSPVNDDTKQICDFFVYEEKFKRGLAKFETFKENLEDVKEDVDELNICFKQLKEDLEMDRDNDCEFEE